MIHARNLRARHGLKGVTISAERGFIALVGPNGSGKTTLLRAFAGLVDVEGELIIDAPFAYLPQRLEFLSTMRVRDVVELGRSPHIGRLGRLSRDDAAAVKGAMRSTATTEFADRPVGSLSGGEQARVGLARALATRSSILLADEPTASLDASAALDILHRLRGEDGLIICAIHDLALAHHFADRVWVMRDGHLVADGGPDILSGRIVEDVFRIRPPQGGWQIPRALAKPIV